MTSSIDTEKKRYELYCQGLTDAEIAENVGVRPKTIQYWRKQRHLRSNGTKKHKERTSMIEKGFTVKEIALREGVSKEAIHAWMRRNHIRLNVNASMVKHNVALRSKQERSFLRSFFSDLIRVAGQVPRNSSFDVAAFMTVWREEYGEEGECAQ